VITARAQRDPHTDLRRTTRNPVRERAVQAGRHQHSRKDPEHQREPREESLVGKRLGELLLLSHRLQERQVGPEFLHDAPDSWEQRTRIDRGAQLDMQTGCPRRLRVRDIRHRAIGLAHARVPAVGGDPDDRVLRRVRAVVERYLVTDRRSVGEVSTGERVVDDRDRRR